MIIVLTGIYQSTSGLSLCHLGLSHQDGSEFGGIEAQQREGTYPGSHDWELAGPFQALTCFALESSRFTGVPLPSVLAVPSLCFALSYHCTFPLTHPFCFGISSREIVW